VHATDLVILEREMDEVSDILMITTDGGRLREAPLLTSFAS
jgi:hypothetical protein